MTFARPDPNTHLDTLPQLPVWVTNARVETPEDVAFLSGAVLSHLHLLLKREDVPQSLLRNRLALCTAEIWMTHQGRPERASDLRDALAFLQPGDSPGPAGEVYGAWRRATQKPISVKAMHRALPDVEAEPIATWLDTGQGPPVSRAAAVAEAIIADRPRDPGSALILADAVLAQALGWAHVLPLIGLGLKRGDLRKTGEELRASCHQAIHRAAAEVAREAADLTRRAARLKAVAPKLRAKGAEEAVAMFLTQDAVAPMFLRSLRSDRAARRLCDRLVELGVVRELTGRDTFRLYGV